MHLEHLNLVVKDIAESLTFYKAVFPHWHIRSRGQAEWYGIERNWVHFGDDYQYLTFNDDGSSENRDLTGHQTGLAHFAYVTENLQAVVDRLETAGFKVAKTGADNRFRKNVYFLDPDGFEVEFVEYLSDLPDHRNSDE
jgi:catechol 2,3-dioxygenase-like lactoylglutathione lyase family enzyme